MSTNGHTSLYTPLLNRLKNRQAAHPRRARQFRPLREFGSQGAAATVAWRLANRTILSLPKGKFEFTTRGATLYGRYVG